MVMVKNLGNTEKHAETKLPVKSYYPEIKNLISWFADPLRVCSYILLF